MSYNLEVFPSSTYKIWFDSYLYLAEDKTPLSLDAWAKRQEEKPDIVINLTMFCMEKTPLKDQYGTRYGRLVQFLRIPAGDCGYGGKPEVIAISAAGKPIPLSNTAPNLSGGHPYAIAGYKTAVWNGAVQPGLDSSPKRSRCAIGIKDGEFCVIQTDNGYGELDIANFAKSAGVQYLLMQDGGGSTQRWENGKIAFAPEGLRNVGSVLCIKKIGLLENEYYSVQVGAFKSKDNAKLMSDKLKKAGFDNFTLIKDIKAKTYKDLY